MLPDVARAAPPRLRPERKGAAIGLWSAVGGAAAAFGPPIGGLLVAGELALGVPGQPALQRAGARLRRPPAARGARPGGPQGRPARCRRCSRCRWPAWWPAIVEGSDWGWPSAADPRRLRARRGVGHLARAALVPPPEPDPRAGRHPPPRRGPGRRQLARLLRRLRRAGARRRPLPHRRVARVGPAGRLHDRPRPAARRPDRLPRRRCSGRASATGPSAPSVRCSSRPAGCGGSPTSARARLGRRLPAGQPARRRSAWG